MRQLTTRFLPKAIANWERNTGRPMQDLIEVILGFKMSDILDIVKLGNYDFKTIDEADDRLDRYLSGDKDHNIYTAAFDLLKELDSDTGIIAGTGASYEYIFNKYKSQVEKRRAAMENGTLDDEINKINETVDESIESDE